jgi:hypothetical protein
MESGNCGF